MICDVCGTNLKEEDGKSIVAKQIGLYGAMAESKQGKRVKELFGKTEFVICHVCYLKSLGIKKKELNGGTVCIGSNFAKDFKKAINGQQTKAVI